MAETFRGTRTLRFLWKFQRGFCPVCNTKVTRITGWRIHYCVPQAEKRGPGCYRSPSVEPRTVETVKTCAVLTPRPRESLDLAATRFQGSSKLNARFDAESGPIISQGAKITARFIPAMKSEGLYYALVGAMRYAQDPASGRRGYAKSVAWILCNVAGDDFIAGGTRTQHGDDLAEAT
jgi:hypothetical protein